MSTELSVEGYRTHICYDGAMHVIATRIRERLLALGKDPSDGGQTWLAEQVGMAPQGIQSILTGSVEKPRKILELARALSTTPEYLLGHVDEPGLPENYAGTVSGKDALTLLERIDIVPKGKGQRAYNLLKSFFDPDDEKSSDTHHREKSSASNHRRDEAPSGKKARLPSGVSK